MTTKITFVFFLLLSSISFSQGRLTAAPVFTYQLNGVNTEGVIHKSDSIFSVTRADGASFNVISIEMATPSRSLRTSGDKLSKEIRAFLRNSKKGERIFFKFTLRAPSMTRMMATAVFLVD